MTLSRARKSTGALRTHLVTFDSEKGMEGPNTRGKSGVQRGLFFGLVGYIKFSVFRYIVGLWIRDKVDLALIICPQFWGSISRWN